MTELRSQAYPARPPRRRTAIGLAFSVVGVIVLCAMLLLGNDERIWPIIAGFMVLFALIGVGGTLAAALGLIGFGRTSEADSFIGQIADAAGEGFVVVEADGRIVYANAVYLAFCGTQFLHEAQAVESLFGSAREAAEALYRVANAAREGAQRIEEVRLNRGFGIETPAWYRIKTMPIPSSSGSRLTLWSVADVTRERERQETVFQELQYAIDYLDHAPAGFLSVNTGGEVVYLNATLAQWLGYDLARFGSGGLTVKDLLPANGAALPVPATGPAGETRTSVIDTDLRGATGQRLPVRLYHQVAFDASGLPAPSRTLVLGPVPGTAAEDGQRMAEVRFARFFNNSPFAIATLGENSRIIRTNTPFLRLLSSGVGAGSDPDRPSLLTLVAPSDREGLSLRLKAAVDGRDDLGPMDLQLAAGGRSVRVYMTGVGAAGVEGDECAIIYALDTTEQRALEAQFVQAQKMQAVGELAGGIAHDFNNVLQAIMGHADFILNSYRPTDPFYHDVDQIRQNTNRAASLVRHLLAFSRRQTLRPTVVQFTEILSDASFILKRLLGGRIELDVRYERELWPVKADPSQFEQVIINLAVNARDAMPQGGKLSIRTSNVTAEAARELGDKTIPAEDHVMVELSDTGTGIAPELLDKIFEPFFTTKEVGKGTGLGLSMVYGFVKQSGGYILCDSVVGKGTRFRILLPRHVSVVEEATPAEAVPVAKPAADVSGQGIILLVEDDESVRAIGARALAQRGYKVLEAASGVEALEVLATHDHQVDLIVSDVVMPEMDGPTFLGEARGRGVMAKIVFVSGYAEDAFSRNLPEGETFGFLPKPFTLKQLTETVKQAIG